MTTEQFKQKFFTNNFYWVNEDNYKQLQEIGLQVGCLLFTMQPRIIDWHEGFTCLGFRTYEKNNGITTFQKEPFLIAGQTATDYNEMLAAYNSLASNDDTD